MKHPWSCQVELTEGCNRYCTFCGLRSIRAGTGDFRFMSLDTAEQVAEQASALMPTGRFEFAMHGEPLVHPQYLAVFARFRAHLPKAQMMVTTNGRVLRGRMQERLEELFSTGLDFLMLDTYEPERLALQNEAARLTGITVLDFYRDCKPNGISPYNNHRRKLARTVIVMDDISIRDGEARSRVIVNQGGNSQARPVPAEPLRRMCTLPFREITVCWNGDVRLCCEDWRGEFVCGNVHDSTLSDIWNGPLFGAARRVLWSRSRDFIPCARCDKGSGARVGLAGPHLPPSEKDWAIVRGDR